MKKKKYNRFFRFIVDSEYRFVVLGNLGFFKKIPDDKYLKRRFKQITGMNLNLDNPQSFNVKIHERNPILTTLVDKAEVKKWVSDIIGEEYVIPTYGVFEKFEDIDFSRLPKQFVIKCTHDSGSSIICLDKDKLNLRNTRKRINKCLKKNTYWASREWAYKDVRPRIIIEKCIGDLAESDIIDYKMMCFNGKVKCLFTCTDRHSEDGLKVTFFDCDWNVLPFERHYPKSKEEIKKPINFENLILLAEKIARDLVFARVDFYDIEGKIYFGEVTLYPGAGTEEFSPQEWDYKIGSMLELPL